MFRIWKLLFYIIVGFLIGMVVIEPKVQLKPDLYTEYGINKTVTYSTVAGNLLGTNLQLLALCLYLKKDLPEVADNVIDELQAGGDIFKTLDGGRFNVIEIKKSNVFTNIVFVRVKGVESNAKFWIALTSLMPVNKQ